MLNLSRAERFTSGCQQAGGMMFVYPTYNTPNMYCCAGDGCCWMTRSSSGMGDPKQPFQAEIEQIIRAVPKCFTSRQIVPAIESSMAFARSVDLKGVPSAEANRAKGLLAKQADTLTTWKNRLSSEAPEKNYCVGTTDGVSSKDRDDIIRALVAPFQEASGVAGAREIMNNAWRELMSNLTFGLSEGGFAFPSFWPSWAKYAVAGVAGLLVLGLVQKARGKA